MSQKACCVPGCLTVATDGISLYHFPNPTKNIDLFKTWSERIGAHILQLDPDYVYNNRRVCQRHFERVYLYPKRLCGLAVPSLCLTGTELQLSAENSPLIEEKALSDTEMENNKDTTFIDFKWFNEPSSWSLSMNVLEVKTDNETDFWQKTWYNFAFNTGHIYGKQITEDFTLEICVEAEFTTLYDQAGLMIYLDEKHWLKAGIEYNDGQPMIGSVFTNQVSDWATGIFTGNPKKFWLRMSKVGDVVCVKYSVDSFTWTLLRLCSFSPATSNDYFVGPMCCSPKREGLIVKFSALNVRKPDTDILHSN